jgi:hypothetical protein
MPQFDVQLEGVLDFEVCCACGFGLCSSTEVRMRNGKQQIIVEPCEKCLIQEYDNGFQAGFDAGAGD